MRFTTAALAASLCLATSAYAVPVTWDLEAVVSRTNLPALGPIAVGDILNASMVVESETPPIFIPFGDSTLYLNLFDSFTLSVAGHTLELGPQSADTAWARESNSLAMMTSEGVQLVQFQTMLYEDLTPYLATIWFEFTDLDTFPQGGLPLAPPSLASGRLRDFSLYSPVNGDPRNGAIFIAGGPVTSWTSRSVPEPSTLALLLAGLALVWVARRESGDARQG